MQAEGGMLQYFIRWQSNFIDIIDPDTNVNWQGCADRLLVRIQIVEKAFMLRQ